MTAKRVAFAGLLAFWVALSSFSEKEKMRLYPLPYIVPEQTFDICRELYPGKMHDTVTVHKFEFSPQVQLWEYREYLAAMKKDSSAAFYKSQLPDSAMCLPETYAKYMNGNAYDNYPVVGVSWDNAMNFLRWKTIRENKDGVYDTLYRLPTVSEWVAAYRYFSTFDFLKDEMNRDYSDWTLNFKDESYGLIGNKGFQSYWYFSEPSDPPVLKRRVVMGNSFHFSQQYLLDFMDWTYYEFHGYAHISFRYVREVVDPVRPPKKKRMYENDILRKWGLAK